MTPSLLEHLDDTQRKAVEYCDGPELVIAGAGSGKTRVLTYKIAFLLTQNIEPERIMALTFTNKAAREMKERIAALVGYKLAQRLWAGTFHSILLRIIRLHADKLGYRYDFSIYDSADSRSLIKLIISELGLDDKQYKPSSVQSAISQAKNALISPARYASDANATNYDAKNGKPLLAKIYKLYTERCKLAQAMDFDDILYYANVLFRDNPEITEYYASRFDYILVDEYQDTNFAQSLIVNRLTHLKRRLCVVGDDAQSIYAFRGANIENILGMSSRFPDLRIFKLERNYRSTKNIVKAAASLIKHNKGQIDKDVYSLGCDGEKPEVVEAFNDFEEASLVAAAVSRRLRFSPGTNLNDMAILYRTNAQSRALEEALRRRAIPYRIYGGLTFYQRKEIKDALAYFRLAVNPDDDEALRRIINFPARGIGDATMKKVRSLALQKGLSMFRIIADPIGMGLNVNKGTAGKLTAFASLINELHQESSQSDAYALGQDIYNRTGMITLYARSDTPEEISKSENLNELLSGLREYVYRQRDEFSEDSDQVPTMANFLSEVSLLTDQDNVTSENEPQITLMTVHAAKGLEFDHVFITGLEENLFPGVKSLDSPAELEEERRLLYVAITRAKQTVMLTYARQRFRNGSLQDTLPSRFISDIDSNFLSGNIPQKFANLHSSTKYQPITPKYDKPVTKSLKPLSAINTPSHPITAIPDVSFRPGDKVTHAKFGHGTIIGFHLKPEPIAEVDFKEFGVKKLILRFAKLTLVK